MKNLKKVAIAGLSLPLISKGFVNYPQFKTHTISNTRQYLFGWNKNFKPEETVLDKLKEDLNSLIGLEKAKEQITGMTYLMRVMTEREKKELHNEEMGMHLVFTGSPGTGKTTVARMLGQLYKEMGFLKSGHLVEVSRADLIGKTHGSTAKKVTDLVESAIDGVLFIDEAHSLARRGEEDGSLDYGREAIDTLVYEMEKHRKDLVVVLAGYDKPMDNLLKSNQGMNSRFKHKVQFDDFNTQELLQILELMTKKNDYVLDHDVVPVISQFLNVKLNTNHVGQDSDNFKEERKKFGNARGIRNLLDDLRINHAKRVGSTLKHPKKDQLMTITREDVMNAIPNAKPFDECKLKIATEELNSLIGLENVKEKINSLTNIMRLNQRRQELDLQNEPVSMHMTFTGNPGTGKTTVARLLGKIYKEMGFLSKGHVVEVKREDLVANYVGQTAPKVMEKIKEAQGGILFIDEAYSLNNDNSFGSEAINTLVSAMEDYRNDLVVIAAGYKEPMRKFISSNEGFSSRFKQELSFEDYNSKELLKILDAMVKKQGFKIEPDGVELINQYFNTKLNANHIGADSESFKEERRQFGNARGVRNLIEDLRGSQANRIAGIKNTKENELVTITKEDVMKTIPNIMSLDEDRLKEAKKELNSLIGLRAVKEKVTALTSLMKINKLRFQSDLPNESISNHMVFIGNPGTGKTTVARLLGKIYKEMGFLSKGHVVEVKREDLVAGYVGQTALKVKEKVKEAKGGILFIDEAYSLTNKGQNDFGSEAINTLVAAMEDNRNDLIVVVAGYKEPMKEFLNSNEGLSSRFKQELVFEDFNIRELTKIFETMSKKQGYIVEPSATKLVEEYLEKTILNTKLLKNSKEAQKVNKKFGNARGIRNLIEDLRERNAKRVALNQNPTNYDLVTITKGDVSGVIRKRLLENEGLQKFERKQEDNKEEKKKMGFDLTKGVKSYGNPIFKPRPKKKFGLEL